MMLLAAAATAFTACNKEADIQETGKTGEAKTIRFYAVENDAETRATLTTEDEKTFKAAWEVGDQIFLYGKPAGGDGIGQTGSREGCTDLCGRGRHQGPEGYTGNDSGGV